MAERDFLDYVSIMGDMCVILITLYTFFLGFISRRVSIRVIGHHNSNDGESFSLTLKNHTMRTFYIKKATLICDKKYSISVNDWSEPIRLEPLGSVRLDSEPFSYIKEHSLDELSLGDNTRFAYIETVQNGVIKAHFRYSLFGRLFKKKNKLSEFESVSVVRNYFNDKLVMPGYKYALVYSEKDSQEQKTIFIHKGGHITGTLHQYDPEAKKFEPFNAVPEAYAADIQRLKALLTEIFQPSNIKFSLFELDEHLE